MSELSTTPRSHVYTIEHQYLDLLSEIQMDGYLKQTRNGKVYSLFGKQITHDFRQGFPLLTTKKMSLKNIFAELRWFLDGDTDIRNLWKQNCHIWDNDWYRWYCKNYGQEYTQESLKEIANDISTPDEYYDLGKIYGYQWRYVEGIDQVENVIDLLKNSPDDRRMLVNAWNIYDLDEMALPPCHYSWQVWTAELSVEDRFDLWNIKRKITNPEDIFRKQDVNEEDWEMFLEGIPKRRISLLFNARSQDVPLGTPYNIVSYAMLLLMLADEVNMIPDRLIGNLGDCHIYENQMNGVEQQLKRLPRKFPTLKVKNGINAQFEDFELIGYDPHPKIHFPLS